jgi:hypothetical protein
VPVHIGEIHAEVASAEALAAPDSRATADVEQRNRDSMLDSLRRMAWLAHRVAADGFDD